MNNVAIKWTGEDSQMFIGRDSFGHVLMVGSWPQDDNDEWQEWKAITLSEEKYCSVAATIRGVAKLSHSFEIK